MLGSLPPGLLAPLYLCKIIQKGDMCYGENHNHEGFLRPLTEPMATLFTKIRENNLKGTQENGIRVTPYHIEILGLV